MEKRIIELEKTIGYLKLQMNILLAMGAISICINIFNKSAVVHQPTPNNMNIQTIEKPNTFE